MSSKKKIFIDKLHKGVRDFNKKQNSDSMRNKLDEERMGADEHEDEEIRKFRADSMALIYTPRGKRDHNDYIDDDESSLATQDRIRETRVEMARTKDNRKRAALKRMKLSTSELKKIEDKVTTRDDWEKHFNQRQHKRYWRHKITGITKWERPYVNMDINGDSDSTDASLYGQDDDDNDNDNDDDDDDDDTISSSSSGTEMKKKKKQMTASAPATVDHGVWIEKYNKKYHTKYWRNKDTKVLSWVKPPRAGFPPSPTKNGGAVGRKVPVSNYIYLKDETYIETRKEMSERLHKEWKEKWSEEWGIPYYKHVMSKELVWEDPRVVPDDYADDLNENEVEEARRRSLNRKSINFLLGTNHDGSESGTVTEDETVTEATADDSAFDTADESGTGDEGIGGDKRRKRGKGKLIGGVWRRKMNARWQCYYYKNTISGEIQWEEPLV